jgi:quercetin dioxygenase-like cupin family protein
MSSVRRFAPDAQGDYRWSEVERLRYKDEGSAPFKDITRQVLFAQPDQACELRYFEVAPGGYSTLERHEHTHAVMILRGRGTVRLGRKGAADRRARPGDGRSADLAPVPCCAR